MNFMYDLFNTGASYFGFSSTPRHLAADGKKIPLLNFGEEAQTLSEESIAKDSNAHSVASLVAAITSKPNWQAKMYSEAIRAKWKSEFVAHGVNEKIADTIFRVLERYYKYDRSGYTSLDLEEYQWFAKVAFPYTDIVEDNCTCQCCVCTDNECALDSDYEPEVGEGDVEQPILRDCQCIQEFADRRLQFLKTYAIEYFGLIDARIAVDFKSLVQALPRAYFHPGTNQMSVDVIHPSFNCYIKEVTPQIQSLIPPNPEILFQWLPVEVAVDEDDNVKFLSHINNLDVNNTAMYASIGAILKKFLHPFRTCLDHLQTKGHIKATSQLERFQVIVKIQELHLTPEKPTFDEGSWHLEGKTCSLSLIACVYGAGTRHERIIATGIYYYEMDNVQDSSLAFKAQLAEVPYISYPQGGIRFVHNHYGMEVLPNSDSEVRYNMELGTIPTMQDLCLVFPNVLQHKVSPVTLKDVTKPGSRKLLVFWLIDPSQPVLSTAYVPQYHLPPELAQQFVELLMHERKYFVDQQNEVFERTLCLCEH